MTRDVVTGAFSYTGRHIAEALLERGGSVRTLTRKPAPPGHPLADRVDARPFRFDGSLGEALRGADTLYNTYWIRFERGATTFAGAVENTRRLFRAAAEAGVRRIVHVSVSNADASPLPYFRGKTQTEQTLRDSGLSYAIVRPTLVYGAEDVLVNNIAWALRRVPLFLIPGDGRYEVQPVSVRDTARICVEAGAGEEDVELDAAGPRRWMYEELVRLVAEATGARARIRLASPRVALGAARIAGLALRDVVLTRDELDGLMAGLLVSKEPPRGSDYFDEWVRAEGEWLGRRYTSELARNFR